MRGFAALAARFGVFGIAKQGVVRRMQCGDALQN